MRYLLSFAAVALCACGPSSAELAAATDLASAPPSHGLRIANWNIEWLGAPDRGPVDDALQLENARAIIEATGAQLWVVAEISSPSAFVELVGQLPGRAGVLASDPEVEGGSTHYNGDEQRVGLIYDPERVEVRGARLLFTDRAFDFAGRPPLSVDLLLHLPEGELALTVIAVHLKAFGDAASRERRRRAGTLLAEHLASIPHAALVAGDWNDGLLTSTAGGESPFAAIARRPGLHFWTAEAAARGVVSYAGGREFLDHQLANDALDLVHRPGSTGLAPVEVVSDFETTTSDHYPVISEIDLHLALSINEILANEPGRDRSLEMVELYNLSCAPIRLDGLRLGGEVLASLDRRTIAGGGALALRRNLGLANGGGVVTLRDGNTVQEQIRYPAATEDGVSLNRVPDGSRGLDWSSHGTFGSARSPGRRVDGSAFGCR